MEPCKYCEKENAERESQMTYIADLSVSKLYLYREQSYRGRCVLVFNGHVRRLTELDEDQYRAFTNDIRKSAKALTGLYLPDKINYLILGDECPHLHVHIVPKYRGGRDFGRIFEMMPEKEQVFLSLDEETEEVRKIGKALGFF